MKHSLRLLMMTLLCAVCSAAWSTTFVKVTSPSQIEEGKNYILVCEDPKVAMCVYSSGTYCAHTTVTISNNAITTSDADINVFKLEAAPDNSGYYLKQTADNKYLYSEKAKSLKADTEKKTVCIATIGNDFQVTFGNNGTIQYNSSSPRFCTYTSAQKAAVLYVEESTTNPSISIGDVTVTGTESVQLNVSVDNYTGDITFTSNPDGAAVVTKNADNTYSVTATANAVVTATLGNTGVSTTFNVTYVAPFTVTDGIFDFTQYGYGMTQDNSGYNPNPTTLTAGNVTIELTGSAASRYFKTTTPSYELRVYTACTMKISAPEGKVITKVEFETNSPISRILYNNEPLSNATNPDNTVPTNGAWEGSNNEVVFTFSGTVYIQKITVTYGDAPLIALDPDTPNPVIIPYTGVTNERVYIIDGGVADIGIQFYDADQTTPLQSAPTWFVSEIDTHSNVLYSIGENTGEERTVYLKVWGAENPNAPESERIYTDMITITQKAGPITIAAARAQETGVVFTKGVVTSISGTNNKTVYIQDATAAICVYGSISTNLSIGDEITVSGTLTNYNGLLEITTPTCNVVSQENEVEPTLMTIAEVNASTNQGWLVKIENATVSSISGNNVTITEGDNSILVRFNNTSDITFAANDIITLTGNIGCYNTAQIANPANVEVKRDKYYVAGTWTDWATNMIEMTKNSDGKYVLTDQELAEGAEFKIIKVAGESSTWYGGQADGNQYWLTVTNHTNIQLVDGANFYMPIAGTWTFTVDPTGNTPLLTVDGSWPEPDYYLVGDFNSWTTSDDYKLTKNTTTGKYTISAAIAQGETFKIIDSDGTWYGAVSNGDFYVEANHVGTELSLASPGNNYYMDLSNTADWSIVFDPANMQLVLGNYVLPDPNASYVYQKVTSTEDLTSGKYLIVYEDASVAFDGSLTTLDAGHNTQDVVITVFDKIYMKDAIYFNIDPSAGTIQSASGKYIGVSTNSNGLKTSDSPETYTNSFAFDEDGNAVISAVFSGSTMTLLFNKNSGDNNFRFRYYKSAGTTNVPIQLYKQVQEEPYTVTIQEKATDGTDYYATMADIGAGYFEVPEGVEVKTVNVINGKLNYPATFVEGDVIPGQGAYLVVSSEANSYTFPTVLEGTTTLPDNDLKSSGKGNLSATAMAAANEGNFKFYKLALHPKTKKVGFFWGADGGAAFDYTKKQQAYLVVEQPKTGDTELASAYYFDGDATGIYSVNAESEATDATYSLSGIRMDGKQLPKGIYIVNGKKVVIK